MSEKKTQLDQIASLAYIQFDESQNEKMSNDVDKIMKFVETLQTINTDEIEPLMHPLDMNQRLRKDTPDNTSYVSELKKIAPAFEDDHYLVPKVIDAGKHDG